MVDHVLANRLTYDTDTDDETMEEPAVVDDDAEDVMEDYFGMSPDWYDDLMIVNCSFLLKLLLLG